MDVDYIIIGCGIAGVCFCEQLKANNKTFLVFDDKSQRSSTVAGGLYNPVVLKRFTSVWKSEQQLALALPIYQSIEKELQVKLDYKLPVYRKFASLEEQNDWFTASDKPNLAKYLSAKIKPNTNIAINAPFGFGEVLETGRIDVSILIKAYKSYLLNSQLLFETPFFYDALKHTDAGVVYKNIKAKHIVFSEGFGMSKNPFFSYLPMVPTKGELLTIYAPDLKIDYVLKGSVFLIPIKNDTYLVGSTYDWHDTTNDITTSAKNTLLVKLKTLINCDFEVVNQVAGIRPTVKDRRPLIGRHPTFKNMYVLNGLGTRGVMIGPYVAKQLYDNIANDLPLESEVDVSRFS